MPKRLIKKMKYYSFSIHLENATLIIDFHLHYKNEIIWEAWLHVFR